MKREELIKSKEYWLAKLQIDLFNEVEAYMKANKLNRTQFAEKLGISTTQLNDICKKYVGTSAKQYILELKLTEAKRLLLYSDHNINEISFGLGFEDSSYFSRIFKNKTSLSPSSFRRKYRNR